MAAPTYKNDAADDLGQKTAAQSNKTEFILLFCHFLSQACPCVLSLQVISQTLVLTGPSTSPAAR